MPLQPPFVASYGSSPTTDPVDPFQQKALQGNQQMQDALQKGDRKAGARALGPGLTAYLNWLAGADVSQTRPTHTTGKHKGQGGASGTQQREILKGAMACRVTLDEFGNELQAVKALHPDPAALVADADKVETLGTVGKGVRLATAGLTRFVVGLAESTHDRIGDLVQMIRPVAGVRTDIAAVMEDAFTYIDGRHQKAGASNKAGRKQKKNVAAAVTETVKAAAREQGRADVRSEVQGGLTSLLNNKK